MTGVKTAVLLTFLYFTTVTSGELRWCKTTNPSAIPLEESWIRYNDTVQTCLTCSESSVMLIDVNELGRYECCGGAIARAGSCNTSLKESGENCSNTTQCDEIKQCATGDDEVGCGACRGTDQFTCQQDGFPSSSNDGYSCVSQNQVCDSVKNCRGGLDESGCRWYGGWCSGFLCKSPHQRCIPLSQVCDGTKQCIDGSDEFNCQYCNQQFRCLEFVRNDSIVNSPRNTRTAQCIGTFRVCDGREDCDNNLDESNCYRWREWSQWSECFPPVTCNRTRTRTCASGSTSINDVDVSNCYDVEDYHETTGVRLLDTHTDLCPACRPTTQPPTTTEEISTSTARTTTTHTTDSSTEMTTSEELITQTENLITTTPVISTMNGSLSTWLISSQPQRMSTAPSQDTTGATTLSINVVTDSPMSNTQLSILISTTSANFSTPQTNSSQPNNEVSSASAALAVIIAASIIAGALLLTMICCLVICFTEKRYKTGKWTPRKLLKNRTIKVPDMYYDIPIGDDGTLDKNLPTSQKASEQHAMSTFAGVNSVMSAIDSGIDANSTSSGETDLNHEHHLTTDFINSPYPERRNQNGVIMEEEEFPPPPPTVTS